MLLPTKLHPRQTRPRTVVRPRLLDELERCAALPLTVVVGPAGAGKSTAVVASSPTCSRRCAASSRG